MGISNTIKAKVIRGLNHTAGLFHPIEKKIVFESYNGRQYSDNPRAICEKMHDLFPEYELVWGMSERTENVPDYVRIVDVSSWDFRVERATAVAFVSNEAMKQHLYKRKGQLFIQTWHGDRGFKKILFDSLAARGISSKEYGFADEYLTDLFVLGSDYAENRIKTAFRYSGKTIKTGCPRNDCLLDPQNSDKVREKIGIGKDRKILLYAPTLRRNSKVVQAKIDLNETLKHFSQRGGDWVCLIRAHPKSLGVDIGADSNIIDVSKYPDMSDLLMVSDALITDYSSCAGDFILRRKPLILAQFDLEQYMEEDRTFHVDINEIGYLIAKTQEELNSYIDTLSDKDFAENCQKVLDYFGTCETGHSAEDVCRLIDEFYKSNHK